MAQISNVAIVGGGCSGALVALQLLQSQAPLRIHLVEPRPNPGFGLAYSAQCSEQLLNVPARGMSVLPAVPGDFVKWLDAHSPAAAGPDAFLARSTFGRYIADRVENARFQALPHSHLIHDRVQAVNVRRENKVAVVDLAGGASLQADLVVLALGNGPPRRLPFFPPSGTNAMFYDSAWGPSALEVPDPESPVLLVGSGLTAVDAFLALRANGHRGIVDMVSPRGLLPQAHSIPKRPTEKIGGVDAWWEAGTLRELVREARRRSALVERHGGDWRDVIASLRGITNELWSGLSVRDRQQFYRHVKPYWDAHRHRMAPQVAAVINRARRNRVLRVHAGRIEQVTGAAYSLQVTMRLRSRGALHMATGRIINCTGPEQDFRRVDSPLLRSLFARGWLHSNPLGTGVCTAANGAVINRHGVELPWLYTIGPMRIGGLLETTAVPEIREQAAALATTLLHQLAVAESARALDLGAIRLAQSPAAPSPG